MNTSIEDRLEIVREHFGMNRGKFAEHLGLVPQNYARFFPSQDGAPAKQNASHLATRLMSIGISANWYLGEVGPMLLKDCERRCTCADVRKYVDVAEEMLLQIRGKLDRGATPSE